MKSPKISGWNARLSGGDVFRASPSSGPIDNRLTLEVVSAGNDRDMKDQRVLLFPTFDDVESMIETLQTALDYSRQEKKENP